MYFPRAVTAGQRVNQEYGLSAARDILAEDISMIEASHKGLVSGVIDQLHFHVQEGLCRHLYLSVEEAVARYRAASAKKE
jgi:hypothetical protein